MKENYKILHWIFCAVCCVLMFGRGIISEHIAFYGEYIAPHITNFSITIVICLLVGERLINSRARIVILCAVMVAANLFCEIVFANSFNTTDMVDGYFGIAWAVISLVILLATNRYGGFEKCFKEPPH